MDLDREVIRKILTESKGKGAPQLHCLACSINYGSSKNCQYGAAFKQGSPKFTNKDNLVDVHGLGGAERCPVIKGAL